MRFKSDLLVLLVLLSFVGLATSCTNTIEILNQPATEDPGGNPTDGGDTGGDPGTDPGDDGPLPLDISGSWDTYASEIADTCGFDPPEPYEPILIAESDGSVTVTLTDGAGVCTESVRTRSGDTISLTSTDVLDLDGAFVRSDLNISYTFTADSFSGTITQSFTDLSGSFSELPCEVTLAVTGTRCNDCWTGCTSFVAEPATVSLPAVQSRLVELAAR